MSIPDRPAPSEYQSREGMEVRALYAVFAAWLEAAGCLVQERTSKWEVVRYRAIGRTTVGKTATEAFAPKVTSHVIYRRGDGAISWTGDSRTHWQWFMAGQKMPMQPEDIAPAKRAGKSWTQRRREEIIERDGTNCYFCGKTMIGHDHTGRPAINEVTGEPRDDMTIEHLLSKHNTEAHAEEGVDVNHVDHLVLAHAVCNRQIGHRPVHEKIIYREIMHDQRTTMWSHPEISARARRRPS